MTLKLYKIKYDKNGFIIYKKRIKRKKRKRKFI